MKYIGPGKHYAKVIKHNYFLLILIHLIAVESFAQEFKGQIINSGNDNPIPFVNVGIIDRNVGTVSDTNGNFRLKLNKNLKDDSLRISSIGYYPKTYRINDLLNKYSNQHIVTIALKPKDYKIKEVHVSGNRTKLVALGNSIRDNNKISIRSDSLLGSEIGLIIKVPGKNRNYRLKDFTFNLSGHFESKVRVNIYNVTNSTPSENILKQPIYFTIPNDKEILTIDLSKYDIVVDHDFFISIENFKKIPSIDKRLRFNGVSRLGDSGCFYRMVSQRDWKKIQFVGVQFRVDAYAYKK